MTRNPPTCIALIPARAGSRRIPRKNIRPLAGHPLIAYSIAAARASEVFRRIVVSTDSEETARIARHYGADVPFLRPADLALDHSPDIEWVAFTLGRIAEDDQRYDCFGILRPSSPFRQPRTIRRAWETFRTHCAVIDSVRAVEKCKQHPGKMWRVDGDRMTPLLLQPEGVPWHSKPYQSLPAVYIQNASLEIAWTRVVSIERSISGNKIAPFITDENEGFDINDADDWLVAEARVAAQPALLPAIDVAPYVSTS